MPQVSIPASLKAGHATILQTIYFDNNPGWRHARLAAPTRAEVGHSFYQCADVQIAHL